MKIKLTELYLKNFKSVKEKTYSFGDSTKIAGANGTGKTTVYDAFCWLLFGKDSSGRAEFEIKRKENGEVLHNLEYSVRGVFEVDGERITFTRVLTEKWVKARGAAEKTFQGNTTEYFINEVPVKQKEYDAKLAELFRSDIFQMLSDPAHFAGKMHWKDRREVLFSLLGSEVTEEDIFFLYAGLRPLETELKEKTIDELTAQLTYQKKRLVKEREELPVRIDTLTGEIYEGDTSALEFRANFIRGGINSTDRALQSGQAVSEKKLALQKEIYEKKAELAKREVEITAKVAARAAENDADSQKKRLADKIKATKAAISELDLKMSGLERETADYEKEIESLRAEYMKEAGKEFILPEGGTLCPTCKRELENAEELKEEMRANFNVEKAERLKRIQDKGKRAKEEKERLLKKLSQIAEEKENQAGKVIDLVNELESLPVVEKLDVEIEKKTALLADDEYQKIKQQVAEKEKELTDIKEDTATAELNAKKAEMQAELEEVLKEKAKMEHSAEIRKKIKEMETEEKKISGQILDIEKMQYLAEQYLRARSELIEQRVNDQFENVQFKLFDEQVNGGIAECCTVMVCGVEYNSANTAGKLNTGLDIIGVLSKHYDYSVPVWIDNRESVTEIIKIAGQVISLAVEEDKTELEIRED